MQKQDSSLVNFIHLFSRKLKAEDGGAYMEAKEIQSAKREEEEITSTKTEAERTQSEPSERPGPQGK